MAFPSTIIIRHQRENLKKCSLRGLEVLPYLQFFSYPLREELPEVSQYVVLDIEGEELSEKDAKSGLILIDATWRLAEKIKKGVPVLAQLPKRALPNNFKTAYPRRQEDCIDPERGLSSVEALYIAHKILKRPCEELLEHYYWKESFFKNNSYSF